MQIRPTVPISNFTINLGKGTLAKSPKQETKKQPRMPPPRQPQARKAQDTSPNFSPPISGTWACLQQAKAKPNSHVAGWEKATAVAVIPPGQQAAASHPLRQQDVSPLAKEFNLV